MKKIFRKKSVKELKVPFWLVDGFNGILALMIYNFLLYLSKIYDVGGIIAKLEEASGDFYLNSAIEFGTGNATIIMMLIFVIIFAFILGIIVGDFVRKFRRY